MNKSSYQPGVPVVLRYAANVCADQTSPKPATNSNICGGTPRIFEAANNLRFHDLRLGNGADGKSEPKIPSKWVITYLKIGYIGVITHLLTT